MRHLVLDRPRQQGDGHAELGADRLEGEEVLLRKGLGRRHQRTPPLRFDRTQERVERDDGFAGADVALQEPFHRPFTGQVPVDLRDRTLLIRGELEGQHRAVSLHELAGRAERRRPLHVPASPPARQPELQREELVEGQPPPRALAVGLARRAVESHDGIRAGRQPFLCLDRGRHRVDDLPRVLERLADHLAQLLDRDLLARRVDGGKVRRRRAAVQVVRLDREVAPLQVSAQADLGSRLEAVHEPGLVEPDRGDLAGLVRDAGFDQLHPAAPLHPDASHLPGDRRLVLAEELDDRPLRGCRLVAARAVLEGVPDRPQPKRGKAFLDGRPDTVERVERELQPLGPGRTGETRPFGRLGAGEAAQRRQADSAEAASTSSSEMNSTWSCPMRVPSTSMTLNRSPFQVTSSPASGARPSWPKTNPASVW